MEPIVWTFIDMLLAVGLLALGWASLASRDPRRAVVLFMGFGLLLALTWVRLRAPDIALAEAAIGAGLTGALLFSALSDEAGASSEKDEAAAPKSAPVWHGVVLTVLSTGLAVALGIAFLYALDYADPARLADEVLANLADSGVSNPVTGVLLNFRAYDTLLELAVMLAAVLGILTLGPARPGYPASGPVFSALARGLVPLLIVAGGYLLWTGAYAPGGAFQAGALLAAAGVLLCLAGDPAGGLPRGAAFRGLLVAGVAAFLVVGLTAMLAGRPFLGYPVSWAGSLILTIETAATLGIAATLVTAFLCGRTEPSARKNESSSSATTQPRVEANGEESSAC